MATTVLPKSGAVSKGYNFASTWDQNAPLTDQQKAAVLALSNAVSERPFPPILAQEQISGREGSVSVSPDESSLDDAGAVDAVLVNTHQGLLLCITEWAAENTVTITVRAANLTEGAGVFCWPFRAGFYKWYAELESAMKSETEEKYRLYEDTLAERIKICDQILQQVDNTLSFISELQSLNQSVATNTRTLHNACDQLVVDKQRLIEFADALRSGLNYFDELENVSTRFYAPNMNIENEQFLPLLKRLDDCILYVESNPQYEESSVYLVKFRQLQSRALGIIRSHVLSVLKGASSQVQAAIKGSAAGKAAISEGVEESIIYVRFKAAASELKSILGELEGRASRREYAQILWECHKLYCEQRLYLIKGIVQQRVSEYAKKEPLPSLTRSGCAYLMQVCQFEHQLFDHFFPSSSKDVSSLASLMDPLCTYLYDTLRPRLIHEANLDALCELVDILKVEVLGEHLTRRGESVAGLRPTLQRILADIHERLAFCARTHIREEIANYRPSVDDLDYPRKLERSAEAASTPANVDNSDIYETWFRPLEKTVSCLSKLYHCLEPAVFTGLAQEAVEFCSISIQNASKSIAKKSGQMDGQLFLIKHLLILREQIAPFDMEFSVTYKELDFSHLLEHLRRILRGQVSLFDWSRSTSLARTFSPRVLESQIDAKKELEKSLKATCEEFIMAITKLVVDPMLSFVTKVTAVKVALSSANQGQKSDSVLAKPLKSQAFASPDKVAEVVQKVRDAIEQELPKVMAKMKLYLQNPSTRIILFKPIRTNIVEAHVQLQKLLKSEYSAEEIQSMGISSIQDLQSQLDSLM